MSINHCLFIDQVKIHTSLGLLYSKSVLCTMPFSLLRANHGTLFHPSLPMSKINSLNSIGWGTLNKIVLHFDSKFWPDDCDWLWSFIALDRSKIEASTKRKLKKPHDSWLIGFLSLWEQWKTPVLVTYIHADSANYFETLSETEAANILVEQLQKMFPEQKVGQGKFALKKCIVTRWGKDPWAQGSYTVRDFKLNRWFNEYLIFSYANRRMSPFLLRQVANLSRVASSMSSHGLYLITHQHILVIFFSLANIRIEIVLLPFTELTRAVFERVKGSQEN